MARYGTIISVIEKVSSEKLVISHEFVMEKEKFWLPSAADPLVLNETPVKTLNRHHHKRLNTERPNK